jgi:hypothetical protein
MAEESKEKVKVSDSNLDSELYKGQMDNNGYLQDQIHDDNANITPCYPV